MNRRRHVDYFQGFVELVDYSCEAAILLDKIFHKFDTEELEETMDEMHAIEHGGDIQRSILMNKLAREFITPIERQDIIDLTEAIDNVTDTVEDVLLRLYMFNIQSIRGEGKQFTQVVVKCCNSLKHMLEEFHNFRTSQKINDLILEVNRLEEVGDDLFTKSTRSLYTESKDPLEILAWDQTLHYLEK
ncbi:MAG: DUF47 family protein [Anaerovorax sp.]